MDHAPQVTAERPPVRRPEGVAVAEIGLVGLLSVLPLLWRIAVGAGRIPAGDAWAYERIASVFHDQREIVLVGWNDITLLGMLPVTELWTSVVGFGTLQLNALGALAGFVTLLAVRQILIQVGVRRRWLPLLVFGVFSGFLGTTGTYLSDLFSVAGPMWACAVALWLLGRRDAVSPRTIVVASIAAGVLVACGFTVRQHAAAAAVALALLLWRARSRLRGAWLVFGITFAALSVPFYVWRMGLEDGGSTSLAIPTRGLVEGVFDTWFALGLLALPLVVLLPARRSSPWWVRVGVVLPVLGIAAGVVLDSIGVFEAWNSVAADIAHAGNPFSLAFSVILVIAAAISWLRATTLEAPTHLLGRELVLATGVLVTLEVAAMLLAGTYYSRYSLLSGALVVVVLAMLVEQAERDAPQRQPGASRPQRLAPALAVVAVLAAQGFWTLDAGSAPARTIEDIAELAGCAGIPPTAIDGGFVWNGMHYDGVVNTAMDGTVSDDGLPPTTDHLLYDTMVRSAVVTTGRPDPEFESQAVGPFVARGLIPWNESELWLVVAPDRVGDVLACREG